MVSCAKDDDTSTTTTSTDTVINVDATKFLTSTGSVTITTENRTLSNGTTAPCYKIVTKSTPADHAMGPWCPTNISDDATKGGIWLSGGNVYDVDGAFIKNLATFYNDATWQMYNTSTGAITKTLTQADCAAAANPNVGAAYKNYCVECLPSYVSTVTNTFYIPITPVKVSSSYTFATGPGGPGSVAGPSSRGIAFDGVVFDAPAPVSVILAAYTIAPFDDYGAHINLAAGYHYHAATGLTKKITQTDGHAAMIGYAMDGFAIYERLSATGTEDTDLDANRGHYDTVRGYHYHVDKAGNNNFINGLAGAYAN
ncbi:MAG: YHYH protein [Saprospiraceae bacterium]